MNRGDIEELSGQAEYMLWVAEVQIENLTDLLRLALECMDETSYEHFYHMAIKGMSQEKIVEFSQQLKEILGKNETEANNA